MQSLPPLVKGTLDFSLASVSDETFQHTVQPYILKFSQETLGVILTRTRLSLTSVHLLCELMTNLPHLQFLDLRHNPKLPTEVVGYLVTASMQRVLMGVLGKSLDDCQVYLDKMGPINRVIWRFVQKVRAADQAGLPEWNKITPDTWSLLRQALVNLHIGQKKADALLLEEVFSERQKGSHRLRGTTLGDPPIAGKPEFSISKLLLKSGKINSSLLERLLETTHIDAVDPDLGMTLLEYGCATGDLGLCAFCYRHQAQLDRVSKQTKDTPFNIAVAKRNYRLMDALHAYGVPVCSQDGWGRTGLHVAACNNDVDGICRLIEWGADMNAQDFQKRTPLHWAAIRGHEDVANVLLKLGADVTILDASNMSAAKHAEINDQFSLMDRLLTGLSEHVRGRRKGIQING